MLRRAKGGGGESKWRRGLCLFENCNSPEEQLACRAEIGFGKKKVLGGPPSF